MNDKLHAVRDYLQSELPDCMISEKCTVKSEAAIFLISDDSHSAYLKVLISFLKYNNIRQIVGMLNRAGIAFLFKQHPDIGTFVISSEPGHVQVIQESN